MKLVDLALRARCDKIPKGWLTIRELAIKEGVAPTAADGGFKRVVNQAVADGLLRRKSFKVPSGGIARRVSHYRYTAKAKRAMD